MVWLCELFCKKQKSWDLPSSSNGTITTIDTERSYSTNITKEPNLNIVSGLNPPTKQSGEKRSVVKSPNVETEFDGIIEVCEKDAKAKNLIKLAIRNNEFLNIMMDEKRLEAITMAMYPQEYRPNEYIIKEGEIGEHLYISALGTYEVIKNNMLIRNFGAGVAFGELGILYKSKRFASIRARSMAKVWILQRNVFNRIMIKLGRFEYDENLTFLKSVHALKGLSEEKFDKVADLLKRKFYNGGAQIVKQGDKEDSFYIIRAGAVRVVRRDDSGNKQVTNILKRGDCFGEIALLHSESRSTTVIAEPPGAECLILNRKAFEEHLGTLEQVRSPQVYEPLSDLRISDNTIRTRYSHIRLTDLQDIKTLGVGSYGRVKLVQHKQTKEKFALKYLKKCEIVRMKHEVHVYNEKDIMISCASPFIIRLYNTYRDSKYLYFLMEVCLGGDLWTVLHHNKFFDYTTGRFIAACVIEGLDYMHSRNMVYRDLKPENLMIDSRGYIKLIDFGFARRIQPPDKRSTFIGTPEYMAPEIILGRGHDRSADYWSYGILVHELLCGKPVFRGTDIMRTYSLIVNGIEKVIIPTRISSSAEDLIRKLCRNNPIERLGYAKNDLRDIKDHRWFNGFRWEQLCNQTMTAPRQLSHCNSVTEVYPDDDEAPPDETSGWDIYF